MGKRTTRLATYLGLVDPSRHSVLTPTEQSRLLGALSVALACVLAGMLLRVMGLAMLGIVVTMVGLVVLVVTIAVTSWFRRARRR